MVERTDLLLNECGDIAIRDGDLVICRGADQIRQSWLIAMRTLQGELLNNINDGMPWFQEGGILDKHSDMTPVENIFIEGSLKVAGITSVEGVDIIAIDIQNRYWEINVYCHIEDSVEEHLFSYKGALPVGSCIGTSNPNYPLSYDSCIVWFDAQDLSNITYVPGTTLRLENKAGAGYAEGNASTGFPALQGVSSLGQKRAVLLNNTIANGHDERLEIKDTMALRPNSDAATIFVVAKFMDDTGTSNFEYGIVAFRGQNDAGTDEECKYITMKEDGSVPGDPDLICYQRSGAAFTNSKASLTAADPFDSFYMACLFLPWTTPTDFFYNGVAEAGDLGLANRKLDGDGFIGAGLASDRATPDKFAYMLFGEMIVFNETLTDAQIALVNSWLAAKWGL